MIPKKKLYANYLAWGIVFVVIGVLYGISFRIGLYLNVFLSIFAASIAVRSFMFGASLALTNMFATVVTLLIYCSFATSQSCERNPIILGSFTPVISFLLWLIFFGSAKFSKTVRSRYEPYTDRDENDLKK